MRTDAEILTEAGEALYGSQWQSDLARELPANLRSVQRWAAGSHPVPAGVWSDLRTLMAARGKALAELRRKLPKG